MPYPSLHLSADFEELEDSDPFNVTPPPSNQRPRHNFQVLSDSLQRALSATTRFVPLDNGNENQESENGASAEGSRQGRRMSLDRLLGAREEDEEQGLAPGYEEVRLLEKGGSGFWSDDGGRNGIGFGTRWREALVAVIIGTIIGLCTSLVQGDDEAFDWEKTVILISLDGFRAEYLTRNLTPTLSRIGSNGVVAEYMKPSFPSITFPNHYTVVTGLYPESHGIVANVFYDPKLNDTFIYSDTSRNSNGKWWGGEPIWVTAIKQKKLAGSCMWPGSEAPIQNIRPTYWMHYNHTWPLNKRVDLLLSWLDKPVPERPHFLSMYIPDVDGEGHMKGVYSQAVNDSLVLVDITLQYLMDGLDERNLTDKVNVIVVSDHGMTDSSTERLIFLDDYVDVEKSTYITNLPLMMVYPNEAEDEDTIFEQLQKGSEASGHFRVWRRKDIPPEYHYSHTERIGPILLLPENGWVFTLRSKYDPSVPFDPVGLHGYNNSEPDMRAIFVAAGSAFAPQTKRVPSFANVEVYNLMARIMGVDPAPNNGTDGWADEWVEEGYLRMNSI
ncbi:hypothetical protein HDV00_000086 [Rhizophlyctis rosea]|nr:hypothetical protein HDV00_000086 [Rhizophlyctis rosea]